MHSSNIPFVALQIRFHIMAMHELCEAPLAVGVTYGFDPYLNVDHMNKIFGDLFPMYSTLRKAGNPQPNEAEFRSYYVLLKLDKHSKFEVFV